MAALQRFPFRKLLVFWLFLLSAVAYLDRTNVSIAGSAIRAELQIDNIRLGWVFSTFLVGYAAFQIPGGWLACRFGPRRVLTAGLLWWGVFSALTVFVGPKLPHALAILIAMRFLLGAGEAVLYPASNQFISHWIPVSERGRANGLIFAGVGAGAGLSIPVLTWLISLYGWRSAFWFSAFVGIFVGLLWFLLATDFPKQHTLVSREELELIESGRFIQKSGPEPVAEQAGLLRSSVDRRSVTAMTMSYFCYGYVAWIYFSWFFIYLAQARNLDLKTNAFVSMIPFLAMTVCCLAGGGISDWLSQVWNRRAGRCGLAAVAFFLTAVFLVIGSQVRGTIAASLILAGGAGALYLSQSSYFSISADIARERAGVVAGLVNMGGQIGGAVTASLTPWIASRFGWSSAFVFAAVLALVGGLLWLVVEPGRAQT